MNRGIQLFLVSVCMPFALLGCGLTSVTPVTPPKGIIFTSVGAPIDTQHGGVSSGTRVGRGQTTALLGLISWGDCSRHTAIKQGRLDGASTIDYHHTSVLFGIFEQFEVVVRGDQMPEEQK